MQFADRWIMQPFNPLFNIVSAFFVVILIIASLTLRKKSIRTRRSVLICASMITMVGFFVYKGFLSVDSEYDSLTAAFGGFNWWGELPLQLCNINMILIPIAVHWNRRSLLSFCFFVGSLGALMALIMPGTGFDGYSLLLPRMLGYYGTHFAIVIEAVALAAFGLYRPGFRDLPRTILTILAVALVTFGVNVFLRATGLHPNANYFFSMDTEGNALLDLFHSWIPLPYLYLLPCIGILGAYMALVMAVIVAVERICARQRGRA